MTMLTRLDNDLKDAMRARDAGKLGVLRMLKSALKNVAIEKGGADTLLDEGEIVAVIRKQVKQRQDSIEGYEKGGRPELVAIEKAEILVLDTYLPKPLDADALAALVREAISEVGATSRKEMGAVMKLLNIKVAGRADGRALSAEVQKHLS